MITEQAVGGIAVLFAAAVCFRLFWFRCVFSVEHGPLWFDAIFAVRDVAILGAFVGAVTFGLGLLVDATN